MPINPHQPPAPVLTSASSDAASRPRSVRFACHLVLTSFLIGSVTLLGDFDIPGQGEGGGYWVTVWVVYAVLLAIPLWLTYFIYRRRNWARWGLVVYFIFSWLLDAIGGTPNFDEVTVASSIYVTAAVMQVAAILLLFIGQGARWLGGRSAGASAEA
jgi:hypothetical protein